MTIRAPKNKHKKLAPLDSDCDRLVEYPIFQEMFLNQNLDCLHFAMKCQILFVAHSPREPPKKERMAKVNKMEKQVKDLEKNRENGLEKVRYLLTPE